MHIESPKERLEKAVYKASRLAQKQASLSVLKCIYLEAKENTLIIRGTNLELGIEIKIPVKVIVEGAVALSGDVLTQFLSSVSSERVELVQKEGVLEVKTDRTSASVKLESHEDFPIIPRVSSENGVKIPVENFVDLVKSVSYSAALSGIRPELTCVYLYQEGNALIAVSTDSFRLSEKKYTPKEPITFEDALIPAKNAGDICRLLDGIAGNVTIYNDKSQIAFEGEDIYVVSRLVSGSFPNYRQIIPKENKTQVVVLKNDLISNLKTAHVFSDTFNRVTFSVKPEEKSFSIRTKNNDVGENTSSIPGSISGEPIELNFNYRNIIDCFQSIHSDSINLHFNGPGKALVITPIDDKSFLYLAMPMSK